MTDRNEALNRLIEAARLLGITQAKKGYGIYTVADGKFEGELYKLIDILRQALEKLEQVITPISPDQYERLCGTCGACTGKPWVGLTLNDITGHMCDCADDDGTYKTSCFIDYAKAIEQKLKVLNTTSSESKND
tara:strand:+ start:3105 stop:3506 length:402 start_codon:yes stop_codon:yes gene_type:complete